MAQTELVQYLVEFHTKRDYYQCHEVLEEVWMLAPVHQRQAYWTALIQIALGFYQHRRGNFTGAEKMFSRGLTTLEIPAEQQAVESLGINCSELICEIRKMLTLVQGKQPYQNYDFPLTQDLMTLCHDYCRKHQLGEFLQRSDLTNEGLIHRHLHKHTR